MIEAFIAEKGTKEFYAYASIKAIDAEAKKAFGQLAAWEHEHMNYIQYLYQAITEDREMLSFEAFKEKVRPETVEGAIPLGELREKVEEYSFLDDLGAMTIALEIEAKAYNFYKKLSETVDDTNTKEFMKDMMKLEQKHLEFIKSLRFRIAETS